MSTSVDIQFRRSLVSSSNGIRFALVLPVKLGKPGIVNPRFDIICAWRLLGLLWRCQLLEDSCWCVEGRHLQPEHALEWSDSGLWYALCMRGTSSSEPHKHCSCCHNKGESNPWWECPDPSRSSWAIRIHMQPWLHESAPLHSSYILEREMVGYFLLLYEITPLPRDKTNPEIGYVINPINICVSFETNWCGRFIENCRVHCSTHVL